MPPRPHRPSSPPPTPSPIKRWRCHQRQRWASRRLARAWATHRKSGWASTRTTSRWTISVRSSLAVMIQREVVRVDDQPSSTLPPPPAQPTQPQPCPALIYELTPTPHAHAPLTPSCDLLRKAWVLAWTWRPSEIGPRGERGRGRRCVCVDDLAFGARPQPLPGGRGGRRRGGKGGGGRGGGGAHLGLTFPPYVHHAARTVSSRRPCSHVVSLAC